MSLNISGRNKLHKHLRKRKISYERPKFVQEAQVHVTDSQPDQPMPKKTKVLIAQKKKKKLKRMSLDEDRAQESQRPSPKRAIEGEKRIENCGFITLRKNQKQSEIYTDSGSEIEGKNTLANSHFENAKESGDDEGQASGGINLYDLDEDFGFENSPMNEEKNLQKQSPAESEDDLFVAGPLEIKMIKRQIKILEKSENKMNKKIDAVMGDLNEIKEMLKLKSSSPVIGDDTNKTALLPKFPLKKLRHVNNMNDAINANDEYKWQLVQKLLSTNFFSIKLLFFRCCRYTR